MSFMRLLKTKDVQNLHNQFVCSGGVDCSLATSVG